MSARRPPIPIWIWVAAIVAALACLTVVAAVFDLGPFREPELGQGEAIARGDDICRRAHEAFVDAQRVPPRTAGEAADLTRRLIDIAGDEADQLESLNGPPEFEASIDGYVAARRRGIEAMREGERAAEDRDAKGYSSAEAEVAATQHQRLRIARRIGFAVCSRPLSF
jgi:hypothetical protein